MEEFVAELPDAASLNFGALEQPSEELDNLLAIASLVCARLFEASDAFVLEKSQAQGPLVEWLADETAIPETLASVAPAPSHMRAMLASIARQSMMRKFQEALSSWPQCDALLQTVATIADGEAPVEVVVWVGSKFQTSNFEGACAQDVKKRIEIVAGKC